MSERLTLALLGVWFAATPLAGQGPSAAKLRQEARALRAEIDSMARAERDRRPVLVRVSVPGGWTAMVSPELASTAPGELTRALRQLTDTFGPAFFPDTLTISVVAQTTAYRSVLVQVGRGSGLDGDAVLPLRPGRLGALAYLAGIDALNRSTDPAFRGWIRVAPFQQNFDLRARNELGSTDARDVTACRQGSIAGCAAAFGFVTGDSGALGAAPRASLFHFAFARRTDPAALARFYADSGTPIPMRLAALAGTSPERLIADWRHSVLAAGNTGLADAGASLAGAVVLLALALAGIRRRSV